MNRVSTSERLKSIMQKRNLKQVDILRLCMPLCEKYNVKMNKSDLSQYVSGKVEPSQDKLVILGMALNVTESWLMGFDLPSERNTKFAKTINDVTLAEYENIKKYRFISTHSPDGAAVVDTVLDREHSIATQLKAQKENVLIQEKIATALRIRLINYYYRLASAGTGQIIFDMPPTKRIEIPDIPEYKKADYAIGVNGNSMEPIYHDGDTLLIEMTEEIERGEIGIFMVDSESYVKKLGDGELISLNPEYDNIKLTEDSKCMGKVIAKL